MSSSCRTTRGQIDAHFKCTRASDGERAMRAHLAQCPDCRGFYERQLLLASLDPKAASAEARIAHGLGLAGALEPPRPRRLPLLVAATAAAAAMVLAVAVIPRGGPAVRAREPGGFAARGGADKGATRVLVYRVGHAEEPARLADGATIASGDELAFAYENAAGKRWLMVFARGASGRVLWYHPAWQDVDSDPAAIPLSPAEGIHELPAAVTHELTPGRLVIHAVFCDRRLRVRQLEGMLGRGPGGQGLEGLGAAVKQRLTLKVTRR